MYIKNISKFVRTIMSKTLKEVGDVFGITGIKAPEDIEKYARSLGAFNFTLLGIRRTRYGLRKLEIKSVLDDDPKAQEIVNKELPQGFNAVNINRPIIIDISGTVLDGYHRLQAKVKAGDADIQAYVGIPNGG